MREAGFRRAEVDAEKPAAPSAEWRVGTPAWRKALRFPALLVADFKQAWRSRSTTS